MAKVLSVCAAFIFTFAIVGGRSAEAAPCLMVTLTGTQGGPVVINGLAGAGTLVRYGDDANSCGAIKIQFDAGRGTSMRLSQIGVFAGQLNAIFLTHIHSDHVDGLADLLQLRWMYSSKVRKLDIVCSSDVRSKFGFTISCKNLIEHIGDPYLDSGEVAQRHSESKSRSLGGLVEITNLITFESSNEPHLVWSAGDVKVSAVRSTHIPGHVSYRVDTPAGSVVIGGDAGNDATAPPRQSSTSAEVERLAKGVDIIVHSTIHPVMGPGRGSGMPPAIFYRQSTASDLGAMAKRAGAKYLMLTHLIPSIGSKYQGRLKVPGGPLTAADYRKAVEESGYLGHIIVGTDLASVRIPAK